MGNFDFSSYAKIFAANSQAYRFANPEGAAKANPSDSKAARTEYRTGLLSMAKGRISVFDKNNDGRLSVDEYSNEENTLSNSLLSQTDTSHLTDEQKAKHEAIKSQATGVSEQNKASFAALDINGDGYLDAKEIANEISQADQLDGNEDGVLNATGFDKLWGANNTVEALRKNYKAMNLDKLGEAGDVPQNPQNNTAPVTNSPVQTVYSPQIYSDENNILDNYLLSNYLNSGNNYSYQTNTNIFSNFQNMLYTMFYMFMQMMGFNSSY